MVSGDAFLAKSCGKRRLLVWNTRFVTLATLLCLPFMLIGVICVSYPFSDEIARKTISTAGLSTVQKSNIDIAVRSLDGTVLRPGQLFSFNGVVGPRVEKRGYRGAPSYLGPENPSTVGGGVCLVSSEVYQLALQSGCEIVERYPHLRTIKSVPPGLDATVWYGRFDMKFKNTLNFPVMLRSESSNGTVTLALMGKKPAGYSPARLNRIIGRHNQREVVVEILRSVGTSESLVSRDHYLITR